MMHGQKNIKLNSWSQSVWWPYIQSAINTAFIKRIYKCYIADIQGTRIKPTLLTIQISWMLSWCGFDRASSLIWRNKMPTRCNRWFLLQILLLLNMFRAPLCPSSGAPRVLYRWLLPVVFGALVFKLSVWCGAEGYVSGLRAAARKPDT